MEGALNSVDFNISLIPKSTHLFFDDDYGNITDVQAAANQINEAMMMSVWCPPSTIELHDAGTVITFNCLNDDDKTRYNEFKKNDPAFSTRDDFKQLKILPIGAGITPIMIRQIIADETSPEKPTRLYFFDFDMLLSQFNGLTFPDAPTTTPLDEQWLRDYSKYLFSDHIGIGDSVDDDRLNLLQLMFKNIGADRAYIITANGYANETITEYGRVKPNPNLQTFIRLLQALLPTFDPTHLKCTAGKKKSNDIIRIIDTMKKSQGGSKKSKNSAKSKKAKNSAKSNAKSRRRHMLRLTSRHMI